MYALGCHFTVICHFYTALQNSTEIQKDLLFHCHQGISIYPLLKVFTFQRQYVIQQISEGSKQMRVKVTRERNIWCIFANMSSMVREILVRDSEFLCLRVIKYIKIYFLADPLIHQLLMHINF